MSDSVTNHTLLTVVFLELLKNLFRVHPEIRILVHLLKSLGHQGIFVKLLSVLEILTHFLLLHSFLDFKCDKVIVHLMN